MRIIAGELKGRRLFPPKDNRIRPTTDKVKESIFSMIAAYPEDAIVIDLFSGTGNLGLEAISRGAKRCYFGDKSRQSIELTKQNIAYCKQEENAVTILGDFEQILRRIPEKSELIFLDPPYKRGLINRCFEMISQLSLLSEDGIIVAEHGVEEPLAEKMSGFSKLKEKIYGTIAISIYGLDREEKNK